VAEPVRRCVGCGRRASQGELVRFAVRDGQLVPDREAPGRGVYTCRRLACFERAQAQRAFARSLRSAVQVDPALERVYTEESND
jgi:predicted RNA-binding protein YlxR (DUF448 family)